MTKKQKRRKLARKHEYDHYWQYRKFVKLKLDVGYRHLNTTGYLTRHGSNHWHGISLNMGCSVSVGDTVTKGVD